MAILFQIATKIVVKVIVPKPRSLMGCCSIHKVILLRFLFKDFV
jgi:hypothetical protein